MAVEWLAVFRELPWGRVADFFRFLLRRQVWAVVTAIVLLAVSISTASMYWQRSAEYEEIVRTTLGSESVPTPQQFKGVEAFILSNVPPNLDEALKQSTLNGDVLAKLAVLREDVVRFATAARPEPELRLIADQHGRPIISNADRKGHGFLFVPVQLLHGKFDPAAPPITSIDADAALKFDIQLAEFATNALQGFIGKSIRANSAEDRGRSDIARLENYVEATPKQVYFITKNGVLKIFNSADTPDIYDLQFPATTYFPSRPYFWGTFASKPPDIGSLMKQKTAKVGDVFTVSKPYVDLGGNGIVMTLTFGIDEPGLPRSVVAFDLAFLPIRSLAATLTERVARLGGVTVIARCSVPKRNSVSCNADNSSVLGGADDPSRNLISEMQQFFQSKAEDAARSEVFGSIQRINDNSASALHVSVPDSETAEGDTQVGRFLLFSLDLPEYRRQTTYLAMTTVVAIALLTLLLAYLYGSLARRQSEYEEAFTRVADVMFYSPTPYTRLSHEDRILDVNWAFVYLLGYRSADEIVKREFITFVEDEARSKYKDVQEKRKRGEPVDPYELRLRKEDGDTVTVVVASAAVPAEYATGLPQTFGIFLSERPHVRGVIPVNADSMRNLAGAG